jgi:hypothetical protein
MPPLGSVTIALDVEDSGWATLQISTGAGSYAIAGFGDCTDAFGDLARGALAVVTGGREARVRFDGEPNEWRLLLLRPQAFDGPDRLTLRVLEFRDIVGALPDSEGLEAFSADIETDAFGQAVLAALQSLSTDVETFHTRWRAPEGFPTRATAALAAALQVRATPRPVEPVVFTGGWQIVGDGEKP